MFLNIAASGSTMILNWSEYYDESGMYIPTRYYIYRGTQPDNMVYLDTVNSYFTNYNDSNVFSSYYYMVGTVKYPSCSGISDTSYSNYVCNSVLVGINNAYEHSGKLEIYPNPMTTFATITIPNLKSEALNPKHETGANSDFEFRISDLTGKVVRSEPFPTSLHPNGSSPDETSHTQITIERGNLKPGAYFIELKADRIYRGKLIVE
jgi:hypothetical protein